MIDIARLMTMLFIIMGHANIRSPFHPGYSSLLSIMVLFTAFAGVPFFFLMAGYFVKSGGDIINWKRAFHILMVMIFWCVIGHFWFGALGQLEAGEDVNLRTLCSPALFSVLGSWNSVSTPGSWDCWFLKVLIPLVFISGWLTRVKSYALVCILCCAGVWSAANVSAPWLPFFLTDKALEGLVYFVAGMLLKRWVSVQMLGEVIGKVYWVVIGLTFMMCASHCFWPHVLEQGEFFTDVWGIVYVLSISKLISVALPRFAQWFATFGPGVFFIYMVQEMLVIQCRYFFTLHPVNEHVYAVVPFAIFAILMLGYAVLRRTVPWAGWVLWLASRKRTS